ncbi:hypothetical protein WJX72_007899 [[Myrmecia] bisecta]|uniref:Bacteriophage/plasmid primase P4 C-terminal domain-containing protein n=1 Tax=[Myrmecia] bisecta TaxID=41462 RepID=A0AAW1PD30_9CHLO
MIYRFNRVRWEPLLDPVAQRNIQHWLDDLLQLFNRLLHNEQAYLEASHPKARAVTKHLHALRKCVGEARHHVLGETTSSKLLSAVKREICQPDLPDLMDNNPYLLGCNNGVLDLRAPNAFRSNRPEDMVSKTVGYDWVEQPDPKIEADVEEMMCQIYPVSAERAMFQLFCESDQRYAEEKHKPHTFKARSDMKAKIKEWRPYLLRWFLAGCQQYLAQGFNDIPLECLAWQKQLVERQNSVTCFCKEHLERSEDPHAYVDRSMLYEAYKAAYPEERIKKTSLGKRKWFQQLHAYLGAQGYHERKLVGPEHCKQQRRDVWVGWAMVN